MDTQAEPVKKKSWKRELLEWALCLATAVVLAMGIKAAIAEPIYVKGNSMLETLKNNEVMLVTKYDYLLGEPERFDVVICHYPNRTENFVKRVVGLPGDTVSVHGGVLTVNGQAYEEDYVTYRPGYTLESTVVPQGEYFVLGDNRANSNDSHIIGTLKRAQIVGHVRCIMFPFSAWRGIE